jgi:hypothetical protein
VPLFELYTPTGRLFPVPVLMDYSEDNPTATRQLHLPEVATSSGGSPSCGREQLQEAVLFMYDNIGGQEAIGSSSTRVPLPT